MRGSMQLVWRQAVHVRCGTRCCRIKRLQPRSLCRAEGLQHVRARALVADG